MPLFLPQWASAAEIQNADPRSREAVPSKDGCGGRRRLLGRRTARCLSPWMPASDSGFYSHRVMWVDARELNFD